jgi:2-keto-4-pentenoate hydratase/2-oxohepta-3-ene-1,7-dioic acid hydratase in catechol pathway
LRIVRYLAGGEPADGILDPQGNICSRLGSWAEGFRPGPAVAELSSVQLLAPVSPSKIVAVGRNYAAHAAEYGREIPREPILFFKPPSSLIGDRSTIRLPAVSNRVEYESELGVVLGKRIYRAGEAEASGAVFGYVCANDISARDLQQADVQWTRAKGFDTFCPVGPWIETEAQVSDAAIVGRVNGQVRQQSRTSKMLFGIPRLISYISQIMTLEPGDLILTGTPEGVGVLAAGDVVQVEVEGIGCLTNLVE